MMENSIHNKSNKKKTVIILFTLFLNAFTFAQVGVGTTTPKSTLEVNGSMATKITKINGNTTLNDTHSIVICDASAGGFTITLPSASTCTGRIYTIKKNDTSYNTITISPPIKSYNVTYSSINHEKTFNIQSDGTEWIIIE